MDSKSIIDLEKLIDELVVLEGFPDSKDRTNTKIDLVMLALEELKFHRQIDSSTVKFEEYVRFEKFIDGIKIHFTPGKESHTTVDTGTNAYQYQTVLLLFLLVFHRKRYRVLDIIRLFIKNVRKQLSFTDFKKTETGVTRCYTNTRAAANVLREYGLLRYTEREAYKTWELSLAGFVVAAHVLDKAGEDYNPWKIPVKDRPQIDKLDLRPEIRSAYEDLTDYDSFVEKLSLICTPDQEIFETFDHALQNAYRLLDEYWTIVNDHNLNQKQRREASLDKIKELETCGINAPFYEEFSSCIQINELLKVSPGWSENEDPAQ